MQYRRLICISVLFGASLGPVSAETGMTRQALLATLDALHQRQAEIAALAEQRAERAEVRDLADALRQDHRILDEWLDQAAEGNTDDATANLPGSEAYQQLQTLEGEEFDAAFLRYQAQLHEQALTLLEQNRPEDSALSSYTNLLKVTHEAMRKHLALIQAER